MGWGVGGRKDNADEELGRYWQIFREIQTGGKGERRSA